MRAVQQPFPNMQLQPTPQMWTSAGVPGTQPTTGQTGLLTEDGKVLTDENGNVLLKEP